MVKLMSVLEKYNLVEKTHENTEITEVPSMKDESVKKNVEKEIEIEPTSISNQPIVNTTDVNTIKQNNKYEKTLALEEIYHMYAFNKKSNKDTIFMLENLIQALPSNLSTDVLKSTIKNIITVSQIDLNSLLKDGEGRLKILVELMNDYYTQTNNEIAKCRAEISRLSSLISDLQDSIKQKEARLKEQSTIVQTETERIEHVIDFFRN